MPILEHETSVFPEDLLASKSDIEAAYASAVAAGHEDPGGDESVITDGMILAAVQSLAAAQPQ